MKILPIDLIELQHRYRYNFRGYRDLNRIFIMDHSQTNVDYMSDPVYFLGGLNWCYRAFIES